MNKLEITREERDEEVLLRCSGRLDANQAGHMNEAIDRLVREGKYHISLDLMEIEYLSSAGIRALMTQYKNLKAVNGDFAIVEMSEYVRQILGMVGMAGMFSREAPGQTPSGEGQLPGELQDGFLFTTSHLSPGAATAVELAGMPELTLESGFRAEHLRVVKSDPHHFAIGLGAIGESYDDCRNRFGEYLMMGNSVAYLPADGSGKPDYMAAAGQLVVPLAELYGIHFTGAFARMIRFEPQDPENTLPLSRLADHLAAITGWDRMAMVMVAETAGLMGVSLNAAPVGGRKIFSFPEVKETMNFTTEPAHRKKLTVCVGIYTARTDELSARFTRPLSPGNPAAGHFHAAVFSYIPLKKSGIDLYETIGYLFENAELADILHLANDTRDITGQGESRFIQGFCWVTPVESIHNPPA